MGCVGAMEVAEGEAAYGFDVGEESGRIVASGSRDVEVVVVTPRWNERSGRVVEDAGKGRSGNAARTARGNFRMIMMGLM